MGDVDNWEKYINKLAPIVSTFEQPSLLGFSFIMSKVKMEDITPMIGSIVIMMKVVALVNMHLS